MADETDRLLTLLYHAETDKMAKEPRKRPKNAEYIEDKGTSADDTAWDADGDDKLKRAEQNFDPEANTDLNDGLPSDDQLEDDDKLPEYADPREGENFEGGDEGDDDTTDQGTDEGGEGGDGDDDPLAAYGDLSSYGLSDAQAAKLHEEGRLDETLNAMDQRIVQAGQAYPAQPQMPMGPPQMQPPQWPAAPAPGMSPQQQFGVPPVQMPTQHQLELNPEDYDPKFIEQMKALEAAYQARFARMEQVLVNMAMRETQNQADAAVNRFDGWIGGLPEEYKEEFGIGPIESLNPAGIEVLNRQRVYETYKALEQGYLNQGMQPPGEAALRDRALRMVSRGPQKQARQEVKDEVAALRGHRSRRPSSRKGADTRSPEQRAIARAEKKMKEIGG